MITVVVLTDALVFGHIESGNSEWRVTVGDEAVDDDLPVVDAAREADTAEHEAVVKATTRRRHVAIGYDHLLVSVIGVKTEPCNC